MIRAIFTVLALLIVQPLHAADPVLQAATAFYDGIRVETLPNGLRVVLKPVPGAATVTTFVAYKVGSSDEELSATGLSHYLEQPVARAAALKGKDPEEAYLALWAGAFENADATIAQASALLKHPKMEFRFIAAHLLAQIRLVEAQQKLLTVLDEEMTAGLKGQGGGHVLAAGIKRFLSGGHNEPPFLKSIK